MVLTRAESIEKEQTAVLASLSPRWLGFVVLLSLVTIFLGSATAVFISGQSGDTLGRGLAPLWNALRWGGTAIGLTASYLIARCWNPSKPFSVSHTHFSGRFCQPVCAQSRRPAPSDGSAELMDAFSEWLMNQEAGGPGLFSSVNWRLVILGVMLLIALIILVQFYRKI